MQLDMNFVLAAVSILMFIGFLGHALLRRAYPGGARSARDQR